MENGAVDVVTTHTFEDTLIDIPVTFLVMKLKGCLFVWVGDQGNFDSLAVAMTTPYNSMPVSSALMGHSADDSSCSLASRLSKKTGKQVFASCSVSKSDSNLMMVVTQRLMKEFVEHPDKF